MQNLTCEHGKKANLYYQRYGNTEGDEFQTEVYVRFCEECPDEERINIDTKKTKFISHEHQITCPSKVPGEKPAKYLQATAGGDPGDRLTAREEEAAQGAR